MNATSIDIADFKKKVGATQLARLSTLNSQGTVNTATAKAVLEEMFNSSRDAETIIAQQGLSQISDTDQIKSVLAEVLSANPKAIADFKSGKKEAVKFLVGQVMKATRGKANPQLVNEELTKMLEDG